MNDGGPAFPNQPLPGAIWPVGNEKEFTEMFKGMTLRDWFAGQVVGAFVTAYPNESWEYYAEAAYGLADALIRDRKVK